jgi:hypothetical protein
MSRGWTSPRPQSRSRSIRGRTRAIWPRRKSLTRAKTGISDHQIRMNNLTPIRSSSRFRGASVPLSDTASFSSRTAATVPTSVSAIARGRWWLAQMQSGAVAGVQDIAARENRSKRHVHMTISLAFLAPSLVQAAVEGRLPHGGDPRSAPRTGRALAAQPSSSCWTSGVGSLQLRAATLTFSQTKYNRKVKIAPQRS